MKFDWEFSKGENVDTRVAQWDMDRNPVHQGERVEKIDCTIWHYKKTKIYSVALYYYHKLPAPEWNEVLKDYVNEACDHASDNYSFRLLKNARKKAVELVEEWFANHEKESAQNENV